MHDHIDIRDETLARLFGNKAWFLNDPRTVYVVRHVENGKPIIQRYLYRHLKKRGLCQPFKIEFQHNRTMEYRCFYTNAHVYIVSGNLLGPISGFGAAVWQEIPWALTREHVAPRRERDKRVETLGNMVPCAKFMNYAMTHMPLAIKLFNRDFLHKIDFDREAMSFDTAIYVRSYVV